MLLIVSFDRQLEVRQQSKSFCSIIMTGHTKLAQRFGRTRISGVYLHAM